MAPCRPPPRLGPRAPASAPSPTPHRGCGTRRDRPPAAPPRPWRRVGRPTRLPVYPAVTPEPRAPTLHGPPSRTTPPTLPATSPQPLTPYPDRQPWRGAGGARRGEESDPGSWRPWPGILDRPRRPRRRRRRRFSSRPTRRYSAKRPGRPPAPLLDPISRTTRLGTTEGAAVLTLRLGVSGHGAARPTTRTRTTTSRERSPNIRGQTRGAKRLTRPQCRPVPAQSSARRPAGDRTVAQGDHREPWDPERPPAQSPQGGRFRPRHPWRSRTRGNRP